MSSYVEGRIHTKVVQVEEARRLKERFPGLPITRIAKLVNLSPTTLYTCQWYQTIRPVKGFKAGPSRTEELSATVKSARPKIQQFADSTVSDDEFTTLDDDFTTQVVQVLNQVAASQRDILALLTQLL